MDLAKIRLKSRQEQEGQQPDGTPLSRDALPPCVARVDNLPLPQLPGEDDFFPKDVSPSAQTAAPAGVQEELLSRRTSRDPLEVILAGREAAGCFENQADSTGEAAVSATAAYQECLCFRVSNEVYGIDIMDIKELIKPREVTEVPRAPSFVSGVISLRGVIIPIIDMQDRLGLLRETVTGRERVIVVRHGDSFSGLLVDEITQVVRISAECIEAAPTVLEGIDRDFVTGIGRAGGRMIILLNLDTITDIHLY